MRNATEFRGVSAVPGQGQVARDQPIWVEIEGWLPLSHSGALLMKFTCDRTMKFVCYGRLWDVSALINR